MAFSGLAGRFHIIRFSSESSSAIILLRVFYKRTRFRFVRIGNCLDHWMVEFPCGVLAGMDIAFFVRITFL